MKIVIAGGSGHLGTLLARDLHAEHEVVILTTREIARPWRTVRWGRGSNGSWLDEIEGSDVVINLAGRSVNCRYSEANKDEILRSRVSSTQAIARAIASVSNPPHVWLQASTATIYAHRYDDANDEEHGLIGVLPDFSTEVALAWEAAMDEVRTPRTRRVKMRMAMVMSPQSGGAFDHLLGLTRVGAGGAAGDGRQYVSWIHHEDFVRSIRFLMNKPFIDGVINIAAPQPLPNREFMAALAEGWGMRLQVPMPKWMLEAGASLLGTETELVLKSRRVVPARLTRYGFRFTYPAWPEAAKALCAEWRALHSRHSTVARAEATW